MQNFQSLLLFSCFAKTIDGYEQSGNKSNRICNLHPYLLISVIDLTIVNWYNCHEAELNFVTAPHNEIGISICDFAKNEFFLITAMRQN